MNFVCDAYGGGVPIVGDVQARFNNGETEVDSGQTTKGIRINKNAQPQEHATTRTTSVTRVRAIWRARLRPAVDCRNHGRR